MKFCCCCCCCCCWWCQCCSHSTVDYKEVIVAEIFYNYSPKGRWIVVDIYLATSQLHKDPPLFTDPEVYNCFNIYYTDTKNLVYFFQYTEKWERIDLLTCNFVSQSSTYFTSELANQHSLKVLFTCVVSTDILCLVVPFIF